jgi:hypothetical protein
LDLTLEDYLIIGELFLLYHIPVLKNLLKKHCCLDVDCDKIQIVEQPAASMFIIRKAIINQIGLFNETLYYYYNDVDFCYRLKTNNNKIAYLPQVKVYHHQNASQELISSTSWVIHYYSNLLSYAQIYFTKFQYNLLRYLIIVSVFIR